MGTKTPTYLEKLKAELDELAAELERVKAERDELKRIVNEIWLMFYGQGLSVANWHQNGDLEPMEEFFEQNDWDPESCRAAHEGKEGENDE